MICAFSTCGVTVPPNHRPSRPRRFCSVVCRNRWINQQHKNRDVRDCVWCSMPFEVKKPAQRYCARLCRLEATAATEESEQRRFWGQVNTNGPIPEYRPDLGPCFIWTGALDKDGYGTFARNGGRSIRAHRFSIGAEGPSTDHLCRVRACVRPSHLETVTVRVNTLRGEGLAAINARKTHCRQGHALVEGNIYRTKAGGRACRTCAIGRRRDRYFAEKATRVVEHIREAV